MVRGMNQPDRSGTAETSPPAAATADSAGPKTRFGNEAIAPYFFVVLLLLALFAVGYILLPFFGDMVIAILFVVLLGPLHARLSRVLGNREVLASGVLVVALVVVGAVPLFLIASSLLRDISESATSWNSAGHSNWRGS